MGQRLAHISEKMARRGFRFGIGPFDLREVIPTCKNPVI
jgi:hypothetical protein